MLSLRQESTLVRAHTNPGKRIRDTHAVHVANGVVQSCLRFAPFAGDIL